jgi:hypothetical protein
VVVLVLTSLVVGLVACSAAQDRQALDESLAIEILESKLEVGANESASITIRTSPGALCFIAVEYATQMSQAKDLVPKRASGEGIAAWTWRIPPTTTSGTWPVSLVCADGEESTATVVDLVVRTNTDVNGEK